KQRLGAASSRKVGASSAVILFIVIPPQSPSAVALVLPTEVTNLRQEITGLSSESRKRPISALLPRVTKSHGNGLENRPVTRPGTTALAGPPPAGFRDGPALALFLSRCYGKATSEPVGAQLATTQARAKAAAGAQVFFEPLPRTAYSPATSGLRTGPRK